MADSCILLTDSILSYVQEALEITTDLLTQPKPQEEGSDSEESENPHPELPEDRLERLHKLLSSTLDTSTHLREFAHRAKNSYNQLESDINLATIELADARSQITNLSNSNQSGDWSNTCPSKMSLRRTNENRLQCIRALQKDVALQRRKNATLERALQESYNRFEAKNCAHVIEVDHLRATVAREVARNQRQSRELDRLKRSERLSKRNGVRKTRDVGHKNAICDLSKQLEGLVLQAARQRLGQKSEPVEIQEVDNSPLDDNDHSSNFDMMLRLALDLQDQTGGLLPEITGFDSVSFDNILDDLPIKPEPT